MTPDDSNAFGPRAPQPKNWIEINETTKGLKGISIQELLRGRRDRDYHFRELGTCGRLGCETPHGNGSIYALPGGRYVNIGHDCRDKYGPDAFKQIDKDFRAMRESDARERAIAMLLAKAEEKRDWHAAMRDEAQRWTSLREQFRREVPTSVVTDIERRAYRKNFRVEHHASVSYRQQAAERAMIIGGRVDQVDANVRVQRFETIHLGDLVGCEIFLSMKDPMSLWTTMDRSIQTILGSADELQDSKTARSLQRLGREFGAMSNDLSSSIRSAKAFFSPANLAVVCQLRDAKPAGIRLIEADGESIRVHYKGR